MTFFTPFMGGAQRLVNGNTLITEAAFGRIFEVTMEGKICWEYVNPYSANAIFRAYKYTPEQIPWLAQK